MIRHAPATEEERAAFFPTIVQLLGDDEEDALAHLGMSREELEAAYQEIGEVRTVREGDVSVGTVWVELRDRELHIHGIVVDAEQRGRGIGTAILRGLESEFAGRIDVMELGVRLSNQEARRLYAREGFRDACVSTAPGFVVLRKRLHRASGGAADEEG